ncbi:MAG: hypothetical protein ACMXYG_03385 [Candidatus Woesearchaeota archaeon]
MEIKEFIKENLGDITFEKHFDATFKSLLESDIEDMKQFILSCKNKQARPAVTSTGELAFIKRLGSSKRAIILKIKSGDFKEIFLGEHKYYDYYRKKIGLL